MGEQMMRRFYRVLAVMGMVLAGAASAEPRPVVVELFTSQGCSSCPPADAYFRESLTPRDDVIALSLHVDYWDYIGWKDGFADPAFSQRQKDYARAAGHRSVFTPQIIVGGSDHVVGHHPDKLERLIVARRAAAAPVTLELARSGDTVRVRAKAEAPTGPLTLYLVRYTPVEEVDIHRGENAGKRIAYTNIVRSWRALGQWDGAAPLDLAVKAPGALPVVAILQQPDHGAIVAAGRLR